MKTKASPQRTSCMDHDGPALRSRSGLRPWQGMLTGLALSVSIGAQSFAAAPSLQGRWTMSPAQSSFRETVTGPAPDAVTVVVSRDDGETLAYQVIESRGGVEVARGAYDLSFLGRPSTTMVDGVALPVTASRGPDGEVTIRAPQVGSDRAQIRLKRTGTGGLRLDHEVAGPNGLMRLESIAFRRASDVDGPWTEKTAD